MKKTTCFVLFLIVIYSQLSFSQAHYFSEYNGVPIIAHTNLSAEELTNKDSSLSRMRELGIYGFYATDIDTQIYNKIKSFGLKVFPYQLGWYSGVTNNEVVKYTDAVYTIWQAEGSGDGELGEAKIEFNSVTGEISQDGKSVISSIPSSSGTLIFGPYYYQSVYYKIIQNNPKTPVNYKAVFTLKIDRYFPESLPPGYENSEVCTLRITAYNPYSQTETDMVSPLVLRVTDFEGWGNWKDFTFADYNLGSLKNLTELELRMPSQKENLNEYTSEFMQYKVEFNGLPFLRLSVDSIFISDQRGRYLFNSIQTRQDIKLTVSQFSDEEYVLGWHGLGEPNSIDNYLPFREMNNLIKEVNPELRVFTSLTSGPWGRYTWHEFYGGVNNPEICPGYEFYKKTGLDYISINLYNYHYPFIPPYPFPSVSGFPVDANYMGKNINYVTDSTLRKYNNFSETIPFSYSSQSGRFYEYDTLTCYNKMGNHINPSFRQFNYHINLGLMFGAREIALDPVFSKEGYYGNYCGLLQFRDGLIDYEYSTTPLTTLGIDFKNIIKPRLSGLMGKTLRKLNQDEQETEINLLNSNYSDNYIDSIRTNARGSDTSFVDVGIFSDSSNSDKKYLMLLSRWYNTNSADRYTFLFKTYRNWVIYDYIDSLNRGISINTNNKGYFEDTISTGDARLYRIYPVVKYGGELNYDETVTSETLTENDLTINSGKTLTIMGTYDCYKNIIVNSGAKLDIKPGSTLNFHNGSKIVVNGLFTANGKSDSLINIDFQSVSGNPLNGIFFGNNSSGSIDNCTIENGYYGVTASSCSLIIKNSKIRDCTTGIYMYGCSYNSSETEIDACNIHDITYTGIDLNNSAPIITNTKISGSMVGIRCVSNSNAILSTSELQAGLNEIGGVDYGIYVYSSDPFLGNFDLPYEYGGYNSIIGEDYHAVVEMDSYVRAQLNWWGSSDPQAEEFIEEDGGIIDYRNYLDYSPFKEAMSPGTEGEFSILGEGGIIALESMTTEEKYAKAVIHYLKNSKTEARVYCNSILDEEVETGLKYPALRLLVRCIDEDSVRRNVIGKINNTLLTTAQTDYNAYLEMTLADIVKSSYLTSLDGIMTKYRNTAYKPLILFRKFSYLYFEEENRDSARVIAEMMESQYPDHELTKSAKMMFGVTTLKKETEETSIIPKEYKLYQNYPNPFNPVTTIKYQLPANSKVTLTIYDILGKEVTKLVDKEQEAGKYEIKFNSGKLASGVYVYRIKAGEFMMSQKMILVK